ncbi:MAG: TetR family transcriptional regulator [Candidimonas sp.]|nr:MAG: TetR family transcriptional regulator [Candidimonas sp.]
MDQARLQRDTQPAAAPKRARRNGKREQLIRVGVAMFTEQGFHSTSIDTLVSIAHVPKGSFTYYFGSKDEYALAVIDAYGAYFNRKLDRVLTDKRHTPFERINRFVEEAANGMERYAFRRGCLVGNLGQELASLNEGCRKALLEILVEWRSRLQACLEEAQEMGALRKEVNLADLAQLFWYAWEGAVMGAKLEKSKMPLLVAGHAFIAQLKALKP